MNSHVSTWDLTSTHTNVGFTTCKFGWLIWFCWSWVSLYSWGEVNLLKHRVCPPKLTKWTRTQPRQIGALVFFRWQWDDKSDLLMKVCDPELCPVKSQFFEALPLPCWGSPSRQLGCHLSCTFSTPAQKWSVPLSKRPRARSQCHFLSVHCHSVAQCFHTVKPLPLSRSNHTALAPARPCQCQPCRFENENFAMFHRASNVPEEEFFRSPSSQRFLSHTPSVVEFSWTRSQELLFRNEAKLNPR